MPVYYAKNAVPGGVAVLLEVTAIATEFETLIKPFFLKNVTVSMDEDGEVLFQATLLPSVTCWRRRSRMVSVAASAIACQSSEVSKVQNMDRS